jgi:hypothetical protein
MQNISLEKELGLKKDYREREDGENVDGRWGRDNFLFTLNSGLSYLNGLDKTLGDVAQYNLVMPHSKRILSILEPCVLIQLDSDVNSLSEDQVTNILFNAMDTEQNMAAMTMNISV